MPRLTIAGFTPRLRFIIITVITLIPLAGILLLVFLAAFAPVFAALQAVVDTTLDELLPAQRLQTALHRAAMPPNDYLIHANPDERVLFKRLGSEVDAAFRALDGVIGPSDARRAALVEARQEWREARTAGEALMAHDDPVGSAAAARDMEQFDRMIDHAAADLETLNAVTRTRILDAFAATQDMERKGTIWTFGALLAALAAGVGAAVAMTRERRSLRETTLRDPLTGLYNRRGLETWLRDRTHATVSVRRPTLWLLMVDADKFKAINDTYGHQAGDDVLKGVARTVRSHLRDGDLFARLGGDEFVVVVPDIADSPMALLAERIRAAVETKPMATAHDGTPLHVTLTIGAANYPGDATDMGALLAHADTALYAAKARGRNCVVRYDRSLAPGAGAHCDTGDRPAPGGQPAA